MKLKIDISKIRLLTAVDIYEVMQIILKKDKQIDITKKEYLWAMALDNSNRILNIELVSTGNIQSALATPKEILSIPLQKKAGSIVLIHNHPMETPVPSNADKSFTD